MRQQHCILAVVAALGLTGVAPSVLAEEERAGNLRASGGIEREAEPINLMPNSTFRVCRSHPRIPDSWILWGPVPDRTRGPWLFDYFGITENVEPPVDGVRVLQLQVPPVEKQMEPFGYSFCMPRVKNLPEGNYTFSVYLRAEKEGTVVRYADRRKTGHLAEWAIGNQWRRYALTLPAEAVGGWIEFYEPGVRTWFAAPQLELGEVMTEYRPAPNDRETPDSDAPELPDVREAASPFLESAPRIDGRLEPGEWGHAAVLDAFTVLDRDAPSDFKVFGIPEPIPAEPKTTAWVGHDANYLYIAARCLDPGLSQKPPVHPPDDQGELMSYDSIELFLAPTTRADDYGHFALSISGTDWEAMNLGQGAMMWDPVWMSGVWRGEAEWTVEAAIPLTSLPLAAVDDVWRLNVCRNYQLPNGKITHSAWSRVFDGFHDRTRFGRLTGIGRKGVERYRWAADLTMVPDEAVGEYVLRGRITAHPAGVEDVTVSVDVRGTTAHGDLSCDLDMTLPLPEFRFTGLRFSPELASYPVVVTLRGRDGTVLARFPESITPSDSNLLVSGRPLEAYAEYDFCTTDTVARVRFDWNKQAPADIQVSVVDAKGNRVEAEYPPHTLSEAAQQDLAIDLQNLEPGVYEVRLTAHEADGTESTTSTSFRKRPPNPDGIEVRRNFFTRHLEYNGNPLFPLFLPIAPEQVPDETLDLYKQQGFTGLCQGAGFDGSSILENGISEEKVAAIRAQMDRLHERDMTFVMVFWGIPNMLGRGRIDPRFVGNIDNVILVYQRIVNALKDHPAIIGWYLLDEMGKNRWEDIYHHDESDIARLRDGVREADPYRPAFVNWNHVWKTEPYGDLHASDIVHLDQYPFGGPSFDLDKLVLPARCINDLSQFRKPSFIWVHGNYQPVRCARPYEVRVQTWLYLVYGTRGVGFWSGRPNIPELWQEYKDINTACTWLSRHAVGSRDARPVRVAVQNERIHYAAWIHGDKAFIFGVNTADHPVRFALDVRALYRRDVRSARRILDAEDNLDVDGGVLRDVFPPTQRRIYEIDLGAPLRD